MLLRPRCCIHFAAKISVLMIATICTPPKLPGTLKEIPSSKLLECFIKDMEQHAFTSLQLLTNGNGRPSCTNKLVRKLWFKELQNCRWRERRSASNSVRTVATFTQCPSLRKVRPLFILITFPYYSHFRQHFRFKNTTYFVAKPPGGFTII